MTFPVWYSDPVFNAFRTTPEWDAIFNYSVQRLGAYRMLEAENFLSWETSNGLAGLSELGAVAAGALPVIVQAGVFVALGAPYYEARELVQQEESASGFSQGFVAGLLRWSFGQVASRFGRWGVLPIYQSDEQLNVIRVNAYNIGLKGG